MLQLKSGLLNNCVLIHLVLWKSWLKKQTCSLSCCFGALHGRQSQILSHPTEAWHEAWLIRGVDVVELSLLLGVLPVNLRRRTFSSTFNKNKCQKSARGGDMSARHLFDLFVLLGYIMRRCRWRAAACLPTPCDVPFVFLFFHTSVLTSPPHLPHPGRAGCVCFNLFGAEEGWGLDQESAVRPTRFEHMFTPNKLKQTHSTQVVGGLWGGSVNLLET